MFQPVIHGCPHWVSGGDTDIGILLLEINRGSCQRAARANGAVKAVNLALGLLPDFRASGVNMSLTIGDIVKLIGPYSAVF